MRGVLLTLRHMGAGYVVKEAVRRLLGRPYTYKGITVRDADTFRALRRLSGVGEVWAEGDLVYFRNGLGTFSAPRLDMFFIFLEEDFEKLYGFLDVKGRTVADVGAYLGETAVLFARMGARHVHAYEPIFYRYVEFNLRLNNIDNATVHPYGVFSEEDVYEVALAGAGSGLFVGNVQVKVVPVEKAIAEVVKMDCEGCEWSLLATPCDVVRRAEEYVVEIHGPEPPLVRRMEKCGFSARLHSRLAPQVAIWHFKIL
jgi:FkbM family methyltransferase